MGQSWSSRWVEVISCQSVQYKVKVSVISTVNFMFYKRILWEIERHSLFILYRTRPAVFCWHEGKVQLYVFYQLHPDIISIFRQVHLRIYVEIICDTWTLIQYTKSYRYFIIFLNIYIYIQYIHIYIISFLHTCSFTLLSHAKILHNSTMNCCILDLTPPSLPHWICTSTLTTAFIGRVELWERGTGTGKKDLCQRNVLQLGDQ